MSSGMLCYKSGNGSLAFKSGNGSLIYKASPVAKPGDIVLVLTADQPQVGPIKSCGNIHDVVIAINGTSGKASVTTSVTNRTANFSATTQSSGCAYPAENPPMKITVVAVQPTTGVTKQAVKNVSNVATGSFTVGITCAADGTLTGLN